MERKTVVDELAEWFVRWAFGGSLVAIMLLVHCRLRDRLGSYLLLNNLRAATLASLAMPIVALAPLLAVDFSATPAIGALSGLGGSTTLRLLTILFLVLAAVGFAGRLLQLFNGHRKLQTTFANAREIEIVTAEAVSIRISDEVSSPIVFDAFAPRILLPGNFPTWSMQEQWASIEHELTHVRRCDLFWLMVAQIAGALYFWSPPVQRMLKCHRDAMEEACDFQTASQSGSRENYAKSLLALARRSAVSSEGSALGVMQASGLERRIRLILTIDRPRGDRLGYFFDVPVLALALSVSSICPGYTIHPSPSPTPLIGPTVGASGEANAR